jgi:hypothetical protein
MMYLFKLKLPSVTVPAGIPTKIIASRSHGNLGWSCSVPRDATVNAYFLELPTGDPAPVAADFDNHDNYASPSGVAECGGRETDVWAYTVQAGSAAAAAVTLVPKEYF